MTTPGNYRLFVYGSLRSYFRSPDYDYMARYFDLIGEGTVRGKLFDTGEYPAAIPAEDGSSIAGELYTIRNEREFAWAICQLDDYEGTTAESFEKPLYRREITDVFINNESVQAWIYWYNGDVTGKPLITSGDTVVYQQSK
jgi:gamma-glutamylcyclotransferase (GGCT)/AIG2-like uncharacterized protein YtfP